MIYRNKHSPQYNNIVSLINKAYDRGYNKIIIKNYNSNLALLQNFVNDGLIISYKFLKNTVIIYINNKLKFKSINNVVSNNSQSSTSLINLKKQNSNNGFSSYYYLNTDKGILSSYEAVNKNIGGKILFKIT